jgi:Fe-S-cluster-containing hydrogenase component 2
LLQGNRLLLIDTRLCVDCDNCVSACARRHGASRLDRAGSGTQVGPFQVPASCYHCDDPLCLYCAEEAIVRLPGGEIQVQTDRCIGCGACAERCPYGNIEMVAKDPPKTSLWKRVVPDPILRWLRLLDDAADDEAARVAVKCDLCAGFDDGPACVRACPVGAAFRTDPRTLFLGTAGGVP